MMPKIISYNIKECYFGKFNTSVFSSILTNYQTEIIKVSKYYKKIKALLIALLTLIIITVIYLHNNSLKILRIGLDDWCGYQVVLYGMEKGIFAKHGLKIELFRFNNVQHAGRAITRGAIDATFTTLWDVMQNDAPKKSLAVVMVVDVSNGADGIISQSNIKSMTGLINKKVGAKLGGVAHLVLLEALKLHKIHPKQVDISDLNYPRSRDKMYDKTIDGAVIYEPYSSELVKKIKGNMVYTTEYKNTLVMDILVASSPFVDNHQKEFKEFILGWFEVMEAIKTKPEEVFGVVATQLGQTPESFASDYAGVKKGDIYLNQQMLMAEGKLGEAIEKLRELFKEESRYNYVFAENIKLDNRPLVAALKKNFSND